VNPKGGRRENKAYTIIAIAIIIVIIFAVFFSTNKLKEAVIEGNILGSGWSEDISEKASDSQLLGLEKWVSYTYRNNNSMYPAYITVTSFKNLFMMSEDDLWQKTLDTINLASEQGIIIDQDSKITGNRATKNEHRTSYIVYDGNNSQGEMIKIIGETWSCGVSGTSIICIGFAQLSNNSGTNDGYWARIIRDKEGSFGLGDYQGEDGLLFNVKCH